MIKRTSVFSLVLLPEQGTKKSSVSRSIILIVVIVGVIIPSFSIMVFVIMLVSVTSLDFCDPIYLPLVCSTSLAGGTVININLVDLCISCIWAEQLGQCISEYLSPLPLYKENTEGALFIFQNLLA